MTKHLKLWSKWAMLVVMSIIENGNKYNIRIIYAWDILLKKIVQWYEVDFKRKITVTELV